MSKNDIAWRKYFDQTDSLQIIDKNGLAFINANELKTIANREPRLLAKQDTLSTRPSVFREQQLSILPVRNGRYVLFRDTDSRSFYQFAKKERQLPAKTYRSEIDLHGFDAYPGGQNLNESQAIDFAHASSLLRTFTGAATLHLVIRSRAFSGKFQFQLPLSGSVIDVSSVQIEIDAGYESEDSIFLIEAKIGKRDDFHIRQLYYPYLEWSRRSQKRIVPIFLIYSNARYYFYEFSFSPIFGELRLVRGDCYTVNESPQVHVGLSDLLSSVEVWREPDVPYPQANDLDKVVDLIGLVGRGLNNKSDIAEHFEFDERQGDYYANAARYLDFIERQNNGFRLTDSGRKLLNVRTLAERNQLVVSQMLRRPSLHRAFELVVNNAMDLSSIPTSKIADIIAENEIITGTTVPRRASTIKRWLAWAIDNFEGDSTSSV